MRTIPKVASHRHRRKYLKAASGFFGGRHRLYRTAREVVERAMTFQYISRKLRKRDFRRLWIARINAAARIEGTTYSRLIDGMKKKNIVLDRKILSTIAVTDPATFKKIVANAIIK
jgi:large subunit ribosomal protein L20